MRKRKAMLSLVLAVTMAAALMGCGSKSENTASTPAHVALDEPIPEPVKKEEPVVEEPVEEEVDEFVIPEGMYRSELTGLPISEEIKDQRPICVMVDNEIKALPHYGTAEADIVYEIMNSTANDRITRLMCVVKDWNSLEQFGSIRSTRSTNVMLCAEYNGVLCHDGGPYYIDAYLSKDYAAHFSGTFSRVNNGKDTEFTEYILPGDMDKNFNNSNYTRTYNEFKPEQDFHFNFAEYGDEVVLSDKYDNVVEAKHVKLPFKHNGSELRYNESTGLYEYWEYGNRHEDAETNKPLAFKNVLIQNCTFHQLDEHGYLVYNCIAEGLGGYYLTGGEAKSITWHKYSDTDITRYYDEDNNEIQINNGKTYITLVPSDTWDKVTLN